MTAKRTVPEAEFGPEQEYRAAMRDAIGTHWATVWKAMPETCFLLHQVKYM